nr:PREDICTED: probable cytochrome P450 305a1 [Megachile rotundata]
MYVTIILSIVILILIAVGHKIKKQPPGPFPWPFIGNVLLLTSLSRKLGAQHLAFLELSKRYNSNLINYYIGSKRILVVSGNKYIQTVLNTPEFNGRPWDLFIQVRNFGKKTGVTMNDGDDWKELRSWTERSMRYIGFGRTEMFEIIKNELTTILTKLQQGGAQRLKPLINPVGINVIWTLATGKPFAEGQKLQYFTDLMERRSRAFEMSGSVLSAFPWLRYVAPEISGYNVIRMLNNELKDFVTETIAEHKKRCTENKEDLIDMFLNKIENDSEPTSLFTEEQLTMILVDLFLAGCTTISTSLDFVFINMVLHQDIQRKVQQEIDSMIPKDRLPDLSDRPKLPYTEAVIKETQRMWPIFPIIGPRRVLADTKLGDYYIEKDSTVIINIYSANMDPDSFPDPHSFIPERFIENGVRKSDADFVTFGKGKRRCPGQAIATAAMFLLFTGILQRYSILPVPGKEPTSIEISSGLAITPKPYEILAVPR